MVFPERSSSIQIQILGSKDFIENDMSTGKHRYSTIEFKSERKKIQITLNQLRQINTNLSLWFR